MNSFQRFLIIAILGGSMGLGAYATEYPRCSQSEIDLTNEYETNLELLAKVGDATRIEILEAKELQLDAQKCAEKINQTKHSAARVVLEKQRAETIQRFDDVGTPLKFYTDASPDFCISWAESLNALYDSYLKEVAAGAANGFEKGLLLQNRISFIAHCKNPAVRLKDWPLDPKAK